MGHGWAISLPLRAWASSYSLNPLGLWPVGVLETTSLGLTSCLHRQLSVMSSEGEGQGRPVPRRRLGSAEKALQAAEAKARGALIQEEKTAMGTVSRMDKGGWRG